MGKIVKIFKDGSYLEYAQGSFDSWCVYLTRPNQLKYPPKDYQYFERLREYGNKYGLDRIYNDFVAIYSLTTANLDDSVFFKIEEISSAYGDDCIDIAIDFSILYMGMVAEENKEFSRLGKKIKRLGVHQVLMEHMPSDEAANFSRGKKWRELSMLCQTKGF